MKKMNSKECTGHRALPENQPTEHLEHLGEEGDLWWPVSIELTADPERYKSQEFMKSLDKDTSKMFERLAAFGF
jgi:hypothetical protein